MLFFFAVEKLISLMDMVVNNLTQNENSKETDVDNISILTANIIYLCKHLRNFGPRLENSVYQGKGLFYFVYFWFY